MINNFSENHEQNSSTGKLTLATIVFAASMILPTLKANANEDGSFSQLKPTETTQKSTNPEKDLATLYTNLNKIDKDSVALDYLKNNLYVNGQNFSDQSLNADISILGNDKYKIRYDHTFEGIEGFSNQEKKTIEIILKFIYKNNNIYIVFDSITLGKYNLKDWGVITIDNTVYDYQITNGQGKAVEIRSKANKYKTEEYIKKKINKISFSIGNKIFYDNKLENTQLTPLNNIKIGKEITKDGEGYYREIYLTENGKYRPIAKVFFNNKGEIDTTRTSSELKNGSFEILGVKISMEISYENNNINLKISPESIKELTEKIIKDREKIISIINNAKIGPNINFVGFNKLDKKRSRSEGKNMWLFDTELITIDFIHDLYIFQRGNTKDDIIRLKIEGDNVSLVDGTYEKTNVIYTNIGQDHYKFEIGNDGLSIFKIKKSGENNTEQLPEYSGNEKAVSSIKNKDVSFDGKSLQYYDNQGNRITKIIATKDKDGKFNIGTQSTDINISDLYNYKDFGNITQQIKNLKFSENIIDIDIMTCFENLLKKEKVNLNNQDLIKVLCDDGDILYCTIDKKCTNKEYQINIDKNYKKIEKCLNFIKERLEILNKLDNAKLVRKNGSQEQDFENFVGGTGGIGRRFVSQDDLIKFISGDKDEITMSLLRGKPGEYTDITYNPYHKTCKQQRITISGQEYKIKVDLESNTIFFDPVEMK